MSFMMLLDITQIGIKYIFKSLSYYYVEIEKNNCMKINIASFYIILHDRKNISFIHFFHVVKLIWSLNSWIFRSVIMSYVLAIDMKIPKWWYKNMSYCLLSIIAQYPRTLEINKILIRVLCIVHENDEQKWDIFHPGMLECIKVHTLNDMKTTYNLFFDVIIWYF